MDEADRAERAEAQIFALRMKHRPSAAIPQGMGACQHCNEPLVCDDGEPDLARRWCDADCRDDWQKRQPRTA